MNDKIKKILVSLLITSLLIMPVFAVPDIPDEEHAADAMWMEPSSLKFETGDTTSGYEDSVGIGYTFTVTVYLNVSIAACAGWQFRINYDSTWLNVTNCVYTGAGSAKSQYFEASGTTTVFLSATLGVGYVLHAESYMMGPFGPQNHAYSLSYVTFEVIDKPEKGETLTSALAFQYDETYYMDTVPETKVFGIGIDGDAEFIWTAPPKPWFALDPSDTEYDQYTVAVNETFDVDVIIDNYYDGWGMTNATFCLSYNSTILNATTVTINTAEWTLDSLVNYHDTDEDWVNVTVKDFTGTGYSGDPVLVATITFEVLYQGASPPDPAGSYVESPLAFCDDTEVWNHEYTIDLEPIDGSVRIYSLLAIVLPHLAVEFSPTNAITFGPAPAVGEEFEANIVIKNLHFAWYLVGLDFRLDYCPDFLEVVSCEEGPYFPQFDQGSGTMFIGFDEGTYVTAMDLILPDSLGHYNASNLPGASPPEDGTIAVVTFRITDQDVSCDPETFLCNLTLHDIMMVDMNGAYVSFDAPENGIVTVYGSYEVGRVIDVYTQYPDGFNGKGFNVSSDMFWPQKEVILYAYVSYNCWPMQQKLVTFTVFDNEGNVWTQLQDATNETGIASVSFRMPWPCEDPESLFGVWTVKADVDIACEVTIDWVYFHYDYLINIVKVTTDEYYYEHCNYVTVTVEFTSHAQQNYTTSLWVTIHDNLNVPVATTTLSFTIGGAKYCTPKEYTKEFILHIDKFAAAGEATVYATPRLYWNGSWVAAGPMGSTKIYILPS